MARRTWRSSDPQCELGGDACSLYEGGPALLQGAVANHLGPRDHDIAVPHHLYRGSRPGWRSEEHTSELQSLMRISYAVFCLKKKNKPQHTEASTNKSLNHN